jgi:hypothetical protein
MKVVAVLVVAGLAAGCVAAAHNEHRTAAEANTALAEFEELKKLSGDWTGTRSDGEEANVSYYVTANGSVLLECLFPGTEHEMVTMYHMDNGRLMLTHYCAAGNQPSMVAEAGPAEVEMPMRVTFECSGGTNMKSENDPHMHMLQMVLESQDHLLADWTFHSQGKPTEVATFDLRRKHATAKHHEEREQTAPFVYNIF